MAESGRQGTTIHQVTAGHRTLREVRHPLPPELLVAEFADELPPDVARAVRDHVETCASCGARARALLAPYDLLASLGHEPVSYVPDLRRTVRDQLARRRLLTRLARALVVLGRVGIPGLVVVGALTVVMSLAIAMSAYQSAATVANRSTNGLGTVPPAGSLGMLYAETDKVLEVQDSAGHTWLAAEIVAVDEESGRIARSLPAGSAPLRVGRASELPVAAALSPDGSVVYELTALQAHQQTLLAFDAQSGQLRFSTLLAVPGAQSLPAGVRALSLAVSPDGQSVYVSLSLGPTGLDGPRALVLGSAGATVDGVVSSSLDAFVPEPQPNTTLPGVVVQSDVPTFSTLGLRASLAAAGALAVSPDGQALFDVVAVSNAKGRQLAAIVRRISLVDNTTQSLALTGDFTTASLAASANPQQALVYLARGGQDEHLYVMSAAATGPTLLGQIPLGETAAPPGTLFAGQMALSPSADGGQVYVSADLSSSEGQYQGHHIWLVDGAALTVISYHSEFLTTAGQALANWSGGGGAQLFVLRDGEVVLLPPNMALGTSPPLWLRLDNGRVLQLLGTAAR